MLSAFTARQIVELKQRDKSKIESVLALGDRVFVGLNTGALRIYTVNAPFDDHDGSETPVATQRNGQATGHHPSVSLRREIEKFSRKPIQQLAIFQDAGVLISLSDGYVSFHDLETYTLSERLDATKGAAAFATIRNIVHDADTGIASIISRLAVIVRRRLLIWTWQDMELVSSAQEVSCPALVKCLTWATGSKVLVGMDPGFSIIDIDTGAIIDINRASEANEEATPNGMVRFAAVNASGINYIGMSSWVPAPLVAKLSNDQMLLAKDVNSLFIDSSGNPLEKRQVPWVTAPDSIGYSYPYLLSLQSPVKGQLELRNPDTLSVLQSISLPNASILHVPHPNISLAHAGKGFLVASERCIWQMDAIGYGPQINELTKNGYYDEALSFLNLVEDTLMLDKAQRVREVKTQKALSLFKDSNFREALELFSMAETPPNKVIALYPKSIAGDLYSNDSTVPLDGKRLLTAVNELGSFLTQTRTQIRNYLAADGNLLPAYRHWQDPSSEERSTDNQIPPFANFIDIDPDRNPNDTDWAKLLLEVAKLVDTTWFKAYMMVNPNLISYLFRRDNFCSAEVVEEKLHESGRYNELIDFLWGKNLHREALKLLEEFGKEKSAKNGLEEFQGPAKTILYLKELPFEEVDLLLQFASWPIKVDPEAAMEIFIADRANAENLPRERVLGFLQGIKTDLSVRYLEHIIYELHDMTPTFHDQLARLYLTELEDDAKANTSSWQKKLETFLKGSNEYSQKSILKALPKDDPRFLESRATILRKMSRHEEALKIYVYQMQDFKKAEDYCNQVYLSTTTLADDKFDPEAARSIYTVLLSLYLKPPSPHKPQLEPALQLLSIHGPRLPALEALEALPLSIPIK